MSNPTAPTSPAFGSLETATSFTPTQIDARARELLAQLSLDEKLSLMDGDTPFWPGLAEMMAPGGYGSRPWVAGAVPRLGIPGIRFVDGPRGIIMKGATTFPVSMARGASWDTLLEERIGDVIGKELRALGGNFFGGVCINLLRHPAWGRAQETYGEDSLHLGELGAALARGVQRHTMACVKHYALNSMENARFKADVTIGPRALHEVYAAHFKRVVDAGVASVMSAYNSVNGEWAGQNRSLLTEILKEQWGFQGFVITDFIFGLRDAKQAALAGQDIEMPFAMRYHRELKGLVESGEVPLSRIEDAAFRILRQQVRFAQGRDPQTYRRDIVGCAEHRQLAREAAEKSIVLLKNEASALPLTSVRRLAVVGRLAAIPNTGDGGSSNTQPAYVVTPLEGIRAAFGSNAVVFNDGADPAAAAQMAATADAAVVVVGYTHEDEGEYIPPDMIPYFAPSFPPPTPEEEPIAKKILPGHGREEGSFSPGGDRERLTLHPRDEQLIQRVAAANPRTIVVLSVGSAVITEAWRERVPGILVLWYAGMEGGHALADVLRGRVNPAGRLPCTFPRRPEDLPFFDRNATEITYDLWHGYRKLARDGATPAFPFGFGLSYTTWQHADLRLEQSELRAGDTLRASVAVTNTGSIAGDEVVQLYVSALQSKVERAPRELKAFARVSVAPGNSHRVDLSVPVADLAYYDETRGWVVEPTEYEVAIARHAHDTSALTARFRVG
ncbi:beta-glucosidase [Opitutus terrae]|uniref:Beta-glucosidase n=1 Tax=Opitutus terrae (strain DSM 11246 / JCM 15787 / PB90-1) TaxID=452637 RepID=B1ZNV3_OPITP|nr:glycoside hydrolase family 3 C-terminal domain-containing protein [Opitutus terrae]ACB75473.1 Beta-glucosidase [Opitutus terrae PB90-1]